MSGAEKEKKRLSYHITNAFLILVGHDKCKGEERGPYKQKTRSLKSFDEKKRAAQCTSLPLNEIQIGAERLFLVFESMTFKSQG